MRKFHRNALTALILGNLAIVPAYALAQDAAPPQDAAAAQEEPAGEAGDDVTELQAVVVSGEIMYRNRTETTAPELVYGQEFFAEFEQVSVGDQLRRVPGVAFTSDIGESEPTQMRGPGTGFPHGPGPGRPTPRARQERHRS